MIVSTASSSTTTTTTTAPRPTEAAEMVAPVADIEKLALAQSPSYAGQHTAEHKPLLSKEGLYHDDNGEKEEEERQQQRRRTKWRWVRSLFLTVYLGITLWYLGLLPGTGHHRHHHPHHRHKHALGKAAGDMQALHGYGAFVSDSLRFSKKLDSKNGAAATSSSKHGSKHGGSSDYFKKIEAEFLKVPSADSAREALRRYTAVSHIAGTKADYKSAIQVASEWAELLGADFQEDSHVFDAGSPESQHYIKGNWKGPFGSPFVKPRVFVDTYYTWLNYPINSSLNLSPEATEEDPTPAPRWTAKLQEDVLKEDPTSDSGPPQFHGYSASGSVSGPIVYANQGSKEDFEHLHALGINTTGAIALVRYGDTFRGLKVRASAEAGCVATIIYSDPAEDGNITEANGYKAYPEGPARNPSSIQRGSVMALSLLAGDPSTPGEPSYKNASRLTPEESDTLAPIPSIPLSYEEAKVLFDSLKGNGAAPDSKKLGKGWSGAIPGVEYWTGPSKDVAHLESFQDLQVRKIWNSYAVIPGYIDDEVVIIGNHRDAWTFGAVDPNSGTASFHEIVAGLGQLVKAGWRPLRTIVVASWDAEEYGLVGSTEFGEDFRSWLTQNAALYHNLDVSVAGPYLQIGASPSVFDLYRGAAKELPHPDKEGKNITIDDEIPLGSGSDFTVFLAHLGISSSTLGYGGSGDSPVYHYHSNYDSFAWMDRFGDPKFSRHAAISKLLGLVTLRSASEIFLPINVTAYALELQKYLDEAADIVVKHRGHSHAQGGAVDFHPLQKAVDKVQHAARKWEHDRRKAEHKLKELFRREDSLERATCKHSAARRLAKALSSPFGSSSSEEDAPGSRNFFDKIKYVYHLIRSVNKRAQHFERGFISDDGLVGRTWYKHLGVAPGRWLGYGATTFPGLVEALKLDAGKGAHHEAKRLEKHLLKIAEALEGRDEDD